VCFLPYCGTSIPYREERLSPRNEEYGLGRGQNISIAFVRCLAKVKVTKVKCIVSSGLRKKLLDSVAYIVLQIIVGLLFSIG